MPRRLTRGESSHWILLAQKRITKAMIAYWLLPPLCNKVAALPLERQLRASSLARRQSKHRDIATGRMISALARRRHTHLPLLSTLDH